MLISRHAGVYAVTAATASAVVAPLLALAYHRTSEGASELEAGTVAAWSDPGRELAGGLLTWASPDRVYSTYLQLFALLFGAVLVGALAVHARRPAPRGLERWGWRIALTGYWMTTLGLVGASFIVIFDPNGAALDIVFLPLLLPGMLIGTIGSSVLGIALLRSGYAPRLTAWLLALAFPLMIAASLLLGHNSFGLVPLLIAWALATRPSADRRALVPQYAARPGGGS